MALTMSTEQVLSLNCEELGEFLVSKGIHSSISTAIVDNRIDGELFVALEERDLAEIAPVIGDRMRLRRILSTLKNSVRICLELLIS